ncbi:MAG: glycerate kinase [Streptococcaceae bacterium]|jgi:glycerate kinase|nr:glycerate kinase [Streptococcaceae bacterium]
MKILVAIDSFKGSATSKELNEAAKIGILKAIPNAEVVTQTISDGGEGTLDVLFDIFGGELRRVETVDLLHRPLIAPYLLTEIEHIKTAIIETADIVGIDKIIPSPETITQADTYGLAAVLMAAKAQKAEQIILTLGGSGTSDGGFGLLRGLGANPEIGDLSNLADFSGIDIFGFADVNNLYAGEAGYANVFGKQKGGTEKILARQALASQEFVDKIKVKYGINLQNINGTGAAGGLGGAITILGGSIQSGFESIAEFIKFDKLIEGCDLLITGEGRMDSQTINGKVASSVAKHGLKQNIPTVAICGGLDSELREMEELLLASFSIQTQPVPLKEAVKKESTLLNMTFVTTQIMKLFSNNYN